MSSVVVGVEHVDESLYNTAIPAGPQSPNPYAPRAWSRLSTFNMPREISLEVNALNQCVFRFAYPNDEPAERSTRRVADGVDVQLGKTSKKVLAVRVSDAINRLQARELLFGSTAALSWVDEVSWPARFACQRNAEVVAAILRAIPDSIREQILLKLRELTTTR